MLFSFSQHGPSLPALKRFHLSDTFCNCRIGMALHYATECIYTATWHMRKPAPNFEEWLKRVANNLVPRQKIWIYKIHEPKTEIFLASLAFLQLPAELN
ncbi:hypothetical protein AVEN_261687-1 [Araneus ventricosus]|uniref:Uncharacterized protein n=1 Tax=Araneus ventricosus TaxID=182803 RepID=A0A4Y2DUX9_ARAVE|nr:hypothetical protein AVEN_261687-1 [Araneus ventricosus]